MTTPARKAARQSTLEALVDVADELEQHDAKRDEIAARRDKLLLDARAGTPQPSMRDVAAIGKVSHAWIRKLERRRAK